MTSNIRISLPCEKQSIDKRDSSSSFTDVTFSKVTLRASKSKKKSKRSGLAIVGEEGNSQTDYGFFPIEANVLDQELSSNSGYDVKNKNNIKGNEKKLKRNIENVETETLLNNDSVNVLEELQMCESTNNNSYEQLKKRKKKRKHKQSESDIEHKNEIVVPNNYSKERSEKSKFLEIKNLDGSIDELQNKSYVKKIALCQTDSPVIKPRYKKKPPKRIFSLGQSSLVHTISDDNNSTHCSTKSRDESKQKKCKRKHKPDSKEPKDNSHRMFDENERQLTNFQNQESADISEYNPYPGPSYRDHVSAELPSSLTTSKKKKCRIYIYNQHSSPDVNQYTNTKCPENEIDNSEDVMSNTSYISNKKSKKKSSSFLEDQPLSTRLNENNYCDVKEASLKPSKKNKLSITYGGEFDESKYELPQNLPKTKTKQNAFETSNEFNSQEKTTNKNKAKKNSGKKSKGILSNNKKLDIEQIQKDLIAQALNKVNSHSDKNSLLNELIQAESSRINTKPNDIPLVVKVKTKTTNKIKPIKTKDNAVLSNQSSFDNFTDNSVYNSVNKNIESKQHTAYLSIDKPLDINKIQQDLLAAAMKSINKSPKSKKIKRLVETVEDRNYQEPNKETIKKEKHEMSKIIHNNKSATTSKMVASMPTQALSQLSTSQDIEIINKVMSDKKLKTTNLHKTNKKASTLKKGKHKPKLNQDAEFDISKFQQELLSAALKKVKSVPTERKDTELHQGTNTETSKGKPVHIQDNIEYTKAKQTERNNNTSKCTGEVKEKGKIISKKKLKAKSIIDPLEDFTTKLLSAELKKRNI